MNSKPEVVISGIGGIFPKCVNLDDFMDLLIQNKNTAEQAKWIENGPEDTFYNNFPDKRQEHFDASFFGVHSSQATYLDPTTRLLMETTFEAIIDAGLNPADISGRTIPVMFASIMGEYFAYISSDEKGPGFSITGQARCMTANRVSYYFNPMVGIIFFAPIYYYPGANERIVNIGIVPTIIINPAPDYFLN